MAHLHRPPAARRALRRPLLAGLLALAGCAKSDVPVAEPNSPVSGTVVPGAAAPGTINLETAPAVRVNVTLSSNATAADVMTLTIREDVGNGRVTASRNAVDGGGVIAFDPIDVTSLDDGILRLELELTNAAGTTSFAFSPVLKDTVPPPVPLAASIPEDPGSGAGSVPVDTINLLNHEEARVAVEVSAGSRDDDTLQLSFSDGVETVTTSFGAPSGAATVLSPAADVSDLADGLVTVSGLVIDRARNSVQFGTGPILKDTVLGAPTAGVVAEGPSNPEGFVNGETVGAAVVRVLFPPASLATDSARVTLSDGTASVTSSVRAPIGGENSLLFTDLDLSTLSDGPLGLTMIVEDAAGNYAERQGAAVKDTVLGNPAALRIAAGPANPMNVINAASASAVVVRVDVDAAVLPTDQVRLTLTDGVLTLEQQRSAIAGPGTLTFAALDASGLADGEIDVTVAVTDVAGNRKLVTLLDAPKDTEVPAVPALVEVPMGPNNPGGFVNAATQSAVVVRLVVGPGDDPDRTVRLRLVGGGGVEIVGNRAAPLGDAQLLFPGLDLAPFPEGLVGLEAHAYDSSGNTSAAVQGVAVLDRSIVGPDGAVVPAGPDNDENVITAAIEAAVTFRVSFPQGSVAGDQVLATLSDGATTIDLPLESAPAGGTDLVIDFVDTSTLADGTIVLGGAVRDPAGNSAGIGPFAFEKDTTSPGAPLGAHVRGGDDNDVDVINLASVNSVEVEVELPSTYDGTEQVRISLEDPGGTVVSAPATAAPAGGGTLVFGPLDASALADGLTALAVEVTDASQNTALYAGTSARKDTLLPAVPSAAGVAAGPSNPPDTINQASRSDVRVVVDLPASYVGDELVSILLQDGVNPAPVSPRLAAPAGGGQLVFQGLDASGLEDGSVDVTVRLVDGAGNERDVLASTALKDVVPPQVQAASVPPTASGALDTVTTFDVDAVTVEIVWGANIDGSETARVRFEDGVASVESPPFPATQTSVSGLDLTPLEDGELTLTVVAADGAANETQLEAATVRKRARRGAPRFTFVAGPADGTLGVLQVDDDGRRLRPGGFALAGAEPQAIAAHYAAALVHVADRAGDQLESFRIDPIDGTLEALGTTATAAQPSSLAVHPSDELLLVASSGGNLVEVFRVDAAAGNLMRVSTAAAGASPSRVAADPSGRFVYAADAGTSELWAYAIDPDSGNLSAGVATSLLNVPTDLAVHPSGRYLFVGTSSSVTPFEIDPQDGSLTPMGSVSAPSGDVQLAVRPDGLFLYTVSAGSSTLNTFAIQAGALSSASGPLGLSGRPSDIVPGPSGADLYVTSAQSSEVQVFDLDPGSGVPVLLQRQRVRSGSAAVAVVGDMRGVRREPRLVYAVHATGESLASYSVDPSDGTLSINGLGAAVGLQPRGLAIDPKAGLAFVVNEGSASVTRLRLDAVTGEPTALGDRSVGNSPFGVALDVSNRFLYVTNAADDSISMLAVDRATGGLTSIAAPVGTGPSPGWIAADPTGQFVYAVNRGDSSISGYRVDPATGQLAPTPVPSVASGGVGAERAVIHPSGRTLYVTNGGSDSVTAFRIEAATGNLVFLGQPTASGSAPDPIAIDPLGEYVIVGNTGAGDLSVYEVSRVTGALVPVVGPTAVVGSTVGSLTLDPNGQYVHASEPSADLIVAFRLNRSTGTLSLVETQGAAAGQPSGLGSTGSIQ